MSKFTNDIEKNIKECVQKIEKIAQSFDPLVASTSDPKGQALPLLDQIENLDKEKSQIYTKAKELRCFIAPKLQTLFGTLKEAQLALTALEPLNLQKAKKNIFCLMGILLC